MCELCANACRGATTRRGALGLSFSALTAAFAISSGNQHQKTPPETQNVIAPDAALDRLMKGNDRYVQGVSCRHDFANEREALAGGQNPFAAVLSCVDSRIAPECFDTARGDLFVGHDACGAVDATIKSVKDSSTLPGHLPSLVAAIKTAVDAVQGQGGDVLGNAIRRNVTLKCRSAQSRAAFLARLRNRAPPPTSPLSRVLK